MPAPRLVLKPGAAIATIDATTLQLLLAIWRAADTLSLGTLTITSGTDGVHPADTSHADGHALDVRSQDFPSRQLKDFFVQELNRELGFSFYAFLENPDTTNEHFHVGLRYGHTWTPASPDELGRFA